MSRSTTTTAGGGITSAAAVRPVATSPASFTTTITLENAVDDHQQRQPQTLVLRLNRKPKKKVTWKEGTVDNEFLQKKSSKKCCIFHKDKPFDEDDSDCDDDDPHHHDHGHDGDGDHHHHHHQFDGACSSKGVDAGD